LGIWCTVSVISVIFAKADRSRCLQALDEALVRLR
jgi:hypothetical protein